MWGGTCGERPKGVRVASVCWLPACLPALQLLCSSHVAACLLRGARPSIPLAVDESSLSGARLSAWRDLRARWSWLDPLTDTDKSWLFFGLYSALDRAG